MYIWRTLFLAWVTLVSSVKPRLRGNSRTYQPKSLGTKETLSPAKALIEAPAQALIEAPAKAPAKAPAQALIKTPTKDPSESPQLPVRSSSRIPMYLIPTSVYMIPSSPVSLRHTQLLLPTPYPTSRPPPTPPTANTTEIIPECLFMNVPPTMVMPPCGKYQFLSHDTREEL